MLRELPGDGAQTLGLPAAACSPTTTVVTDSEVDSESGGCASPAETRTFECPEPECGRRFNRKFTLQEHLKTHTGEKPYCCRVPTCGKRFSTSGNLSRHHRLHVTKSFRCPSPNCSRVFARQDKLLQHVRVHMDGDGYMCSFPGCGKTFSTAGNCSRHRRTQHPTDPIADENPSQIHTRRLEAHLSIAFDQNSSECWLPPRVQGSLAHPFAAIPSDPIAGISDSEIAELLECLFDDDTDDDDAEVSLGYTIASLRQCMNSSIETEMDVAPAYASEYTACL